MDSNTTVLVMKTVITIIDIVSDDYTKCRMEYKVIIERCESQWRYLPEHPPPHVKYGTHTDMEDQNDFRYGDHPQFIKELSYINSRGLMNFPPQSISSGPLPGEIIFLYSVLFPH